MKLRTGPMLAVAFAPVMAMSCAPAAPKVPAPVTATAPSKPPVAKAPAVPPVPPPRAPLVGPGGEEAAIVYRSVKVVLPTGEERLIEPGDLHPPAGDPSLHGILPTALLYLNDGTLLVGMADGTLTAIDSAGHRRFSVGFLGGITGLTATGDGLAAVTTDRGALALVGSDGQVRWERQVAFDRLSPAVLGPNGMILAASVRGVVALSPEGAPMFAHALSIPRACCGQRDELDLKLDASGKVTVNKDVSFQLDGPHPPLANLEPTFPLTYRRVLRERIVALLPDGPTGVVALQNATYGGPFTLLRVEENGSTSIPVPSQGFRPEAFLANAKPELGKLRIDGLSRGPNGNPWILAERLSSGEANGNRASAVGQILELSGGTVRERRDLFEAFSQHPTWGIMASTDARLLCFGAANPTCASWDGAAFRMVAPPGAVWAAGRVGEETWVSTKGGRVFRFDGAAFTELPKPEGAEVTALGGASGQDVWAATRKEREVSHFDGTAWAVVSTPASVEGFVVRAADDVWATDGKTRWDGNRWSRVFGIPEAVAVVARSKDDVWVGGALLNYDRNTALQVLPKQFEDRMGTVKTKDEHTASDVVGAELPAMLQALVSPFVAGGLVPAAQKGGHQ